jgi:hypothetical protein
VFSVTRAIILRLFLLLLLLLHLLRLQYVLVIPLLLGHVTVNFPSTGTYTSLVLRLSIVLLRPAAVALVLLVKLNHV